jgi:RND family efflux transporter MFP subunit
MRGARSTFLAALLLVSGGAAADEKPRLVATALLEPAPYQLTLPEKVAVLRAGEHRDLAFEVSGRLESIAAEGARVEAGAVVAQLDAALERAHLRQAELQLREALSERKRIRGLRKSDAVSAKGLERAETGADLRMAERDAARERLERKRLVAPFAGVINEVHFEPGEVVNPGVAVATLMSLDTLRLDVGIPGYQVGLVAPGGRVLVSVRALSDEPFEGVVHRVAAAAAEQRHLFEVEIRVANPEGRLRPG